LSFPPCCAILFNLHVYVGLLGKNSIIVVEDELDPVVIFAEMMHISGFNWLKAFVMNPNKSMINKEQPTDIQTRLEAMVSIYLFKPLDFIDLKGAVETGFRT
jgi:hypothetical protein